ncbi:MAG: restriction endonuclease subunit S [Cytophagaceae bacterium BCCC1]|nr:MAG: restriction endonuclease subunit S [Cytophagaceae bacterium BCCC1]
MTAKIPKLRFVEFSDEENKSYIKHSFSDIFLFSTGKNIKQNEASPDFETPCVRYGELYYMYNEVITKIFNKTNLDKSELLLSKGDEILLPSAGEDPIDIGSASALTIENVAIGRTINILKPFKDNVYSQIYVAYYINHKLRKKISSLAKGSSISNVYNSDLKTLEITLPTLAEQTKIAKFLTAVDEKIQSLKEKKCLLEEYKKGLMQKIFSQQIRFKQEDGSDFPEWEEKSLGSFFQERNESPKEDLPLFSLTIENGIVAKSDRYERSFLVNDLENAYKVIHVNDFAFNPMNLRFGALARNKNKLNGLVSKYYNVFYCLENCCIPYMEYYLTSYNMIQYYNKMSTGSLIEKKRVHYLDFINFKKLIPVIEEQQKIASFLTSIDEKIEKVGHQIVDVQTFKKGLLQQMFL